MYWSLPSSRRRFSRSSAYLRLSASLSTVTVMHPFNPGAWIGGQLELDARPAQQAEALVDGPVRAGDAGHPAEPGQAGHGDGAGRGPGVVDEGRADGLGHLVGGRAERVERL